MPQSTSKHFINGAYVMSIKICIMQKRRKQKVQTETKEKTSFFLKLRKDTILIYLFETWFDKFVLSKYIDKIWTVHFMTAQIKHSNILPCPCKFQGYLQQIRAVKPHDAYYILFLLRFPMKLLAFSFDISCSAWLNVLISHILLWR